MARRTSHLTAICLPLDPDGWRDDLAPNTGGDDSSYSETGPRPGLCVPEDDRSVLRPILSGAQAADMELAVLAGGHASLDYGGAVQVGYRFAGEAASLVRGWSAPNWVTGWSSPVWTTSVAYDGIVATTIASSQVVAITYRDPTDSTRYVTTYDPTTCEWSAPVSVYTSSTTADVLVAVGDRLLCTASNRVYRSDDAGVTWTLHSNGIWPSDVTPSDYESASGAVGVDGSIVAFLWDSAGATFVRQMASLDGLSTWTTVFVDDSLARAVPSVVALPTGGFVTAYIRDADGYICVAALNHAYLPLTSAVPVIVAVSQACTECTLTIDPDGLLWLHWSADPADGKVHVSVSIDGGGTWQAMDEGAIRGLSTSDAAITSYTSAPCEGSVVLVGHPSGSTSTSTNGSIVAVRLGGWSNLPASTPDWTDARDWTSRSGHGPSGGSNAVWMPGELPGDSGWTSSGAASQTFLSDGRLRVLTSGGDARSYSRTGITSQNPATVMAGLVCPSGGALTGNEIAIDRWVSWTGHEYRMVVRFSETDGIRVRDASAGTTLATLAYDTTEPFQICMLVSTTSVNSGCWVRRPYETTWTTVWSGALTDNTATPTGSGGLEFGNLATSSGVMSVWYYVADSTSGAVGQGLSATSAVGRPLTSIPVPLPAETGRAWLAAQSGPGALGETFTVDVAHDYPVEALLPTVSPSPAVQWRSQDTTEQIIAWDHGRRTLVGDSIALFCLNANFREAVLEYFDSPSWVEAGTLDLATGFTGLDADLTGKVLTPGGVSAGARYLAEGEAAGGHVVFTTSGDARRIQWNTAGWWGGSGPQVRLILEGIDGTEDTSGGVDLVLPSGVLVVHTADLQIRSKWRVRIPASQVTPDGDYRAGVLVPMALRILGRAPDWGWSRELEPNSATTTSRSGTTRTQSRGKPIRNWSVGWESGVDLFDVRGQAVEPMWLSPDEHDRGTTWQDVPWLLEGLVTLSESGAVPCVALAVVPADGVTINDPSLFVYGRMTGSVRQDNVAGIEGSSEVVRVGQVVIREVI
jgi:hypothetical protein